MKKIVFVIVTLALFISFPAMAQEAILSYHSNIDVRSDGVLHVLEKIEVRAENRKIRHGIYRDFPTIYHNRLGATQRVGFHLLGVRRNGEDERHHEKKLSNGIRIYIGNPDVTLTPGIYQYEIEYTTDRQLGFFDNFDELYFNVTGNGWIFPIEQASATVSLPTRVNDNEVKLTGYTGAQGSKAQNLRHSITPNGRFYFTTTQALRPYEGLTIVADWPKGIITAPSQQQMRQQFIQDNRPLMIAGGGLLAVLAYYLLVWIKVGKDPQAGVIYPRYRAPDGFSPASIRFIRNMKYDKSCFTAALINLAMKGVITIDKDKNDDFVLTRQPQATADLAPGEAVIMQSLFDSSERITLSQSEHARLSKAIGQHEKSLRRNFEKIYFLNNRKYFVPGLVLSLAFIIGSISQIDQPDALFGTVFIGIFALFPILILLQLKKTWQRKKKGGAIFSALIQFLFLGVFIYLGSDVIKPMLTSSPPLNWLVIVAIVALVVINVLFFNWLKAPTLAGRKLLDQIDSFKLYLNVAEADDIKLSGEPEFNSNLYQQFLPYAIALGVDSAWSKKLQQAMDAGQVDAQYRPEGLLYIQRYDDIGQFSQSLSSDFDSAISAASTPPGSSSGFSGGSSGGGGGGGGGGGW